MYLFTSVARLAEPLFNGMFVVGRTSWFGIEFKAFYSTAYGVVPRFFGEGTAAEVGIGHKTQPSFT